jgi:ribonuclease HI
MIYTNSDGGARGNPGQGAIGVVVRDSEVVLEEFGKKIGDNVTNNIAEYNGLIEALKTASKYTTKEVTCILDSELVVKQVLGEYKVKQEHLKKLFLEVQKLIDKFEKVKFVHVSRWDEFQQRADRLLNDELDKKL